MFRVCVGVCSSSLLTSISTSTSSRLTPIFRSTRPPKGRLSSTESSGKMGTMADTSSVFCSRFWCFTSAARAKMGISG